TGLEESRATAAVDSLRPIRPSKNESRRSESFPRTNPSEIALISDSAVKPNLPRARRNPGAAKASDCEVAKLFWALARRCHEVSILPSTADRCLLRGRLNIRNPYIRNPSTLPAQGLRFALSVARNYGIRGDSSFVFRFFWPVHHKADRSPEKVGGVVYRLK